MGVDEISLDGRTAIVAGGGGHGIGGAISRLLARAGAAVAVVDVDPQNAQAAVDDIASAGGKAVPVIESVFAEEGCANIARRTREELGGIDILVNVVGSMQGHATWGRMTDWSVEGWDEVIGLNLRNVFLLCREVIPTMRAQERGAIVNIASVSGAVAAPLHSAYGAAKAGLINFTRTLALEYARSGIRVNAVSPGSIATPTAVTTDERIAAHQSSVPMARMGEPHEIAGAVLFLASNLASHVTGQQLIVDGGASVRMPVPLGSRRTYMAG